MEGVSAARIWRELAEIAMQFTKPLEYPILKSHRALTDKSRFLDEDCCHPDYDKQAVIDLYIGLGHQTLAVGHSAQDLAMIRKATSGCLYCPMRAARLLGWGIPMFYERKDIGVLAKRSSGAVHRCPAARIKVEETMQINRKGLDVEVRKYAAPRRWRLWRTCPACPPADHRIRQTEAHGIRCVGGGLKIWAAKDNSSPTGDFRCSERYRRLSHPSPIRRAGSKRSFGGLAKRPASACKSPGQTTNIPIRMGENRD
jgi:hypothetical protein